MDIPEDKLYRIITLTKGLYEGEHKLYWNSYICKLFEHCERVYKWGNNEVLDAVAGDWVETYDGTVFQILHKRIYKDKKRNRQFVFFRFPIATVYAWETLKGYKYRQLFGNFMSMSRGNMKSNTIAGSSNQKIRFATYLVSGLNPLKAYRLAFNNYATLPVTTLHRRVNQMITDEIVKKELFEQLEPLVEKLNTEFSDQRLVDELKELLDRSRKGSDAHRENIKFIMALLNKLPDAMYPNNKNKKIATEIQYQEVPKLGQIE
ncbi:hypothetical protein [Immundisolibacter sp.]